MLFATADELERKKLAQATGLVDNRTTQEAVTSLLKPVAPQSPWEQAEEEYGAGEAVMRRLGNLFTGGLFDEQIIPEYTAGSHSAYKQAVKDYGTQMTAYNQAAALEGMDLSQITPADIALGHAASPKLGEYLTDNYAAQNAEAGTDHEVAKLAGVPYAQWTRRSPEQKRADRNYYQQQNGDGGYFDAQLAATGKLPEQLMAGKQAESEGTGRGNEVTSDRQQVTGIRRQIKDIDRGIQSVGDVRELIALRQADPGKFAAGMRNVFGVETYEDGRMSAVAAQSVIDQLKEVTLGAISKSELELLLGGLLDPSRSPESNLGSLDTALERMEASKELAVDDARLAWGRLSKDEGQADYLGQQAEDDWYYLNLGEGSQLKPITSMVDGEERSVSFSDYYRARQEQAGPYEDLSREQIVVDYRKAREAEKEMWEKQQQVKADLQEEARRALELEFME